MENKYSKPNTTRKKVKFLGTKEFIDASTGEKETMQVTNIEERDANFHKIWLGHMLESLDMIGNQKIRVAMFIMENINKENELIMTYRVIAEKNNTSLQTVSETMKELIERNKIKKKQKKRYAIYNKENNNKENELIMTYRVIAEKTNTSLQTVSETMKALQESNLLSKIRNGYYRVNPDVIFKGGRNDRMNVLLRYSKGE